jgi:hypothetical protein
VFRRVSWLPGGGGLTAPIPGLTAPFWTTGFRVVSTVVGACVLRLLVVFVPRTSSTPVATWFCQTEGRSAECVILGVRLSEFILSEFQSPSRRIFIGSHSLPPLWSPNRFFQHRSPSSSLLLELEVEYAELESMSLAPTIAWALPQPSFFLDRQSSLCLLLCLCLWSRLDRYLPSVFDLCL